LLTLREERRLRVFENKRDEVTGEWRKLLNEEFNDLYPSPNNVLVMKSRRIRWAVYVAGKPEGKRPLGRSRRRWEDNIKMDLQEVFCGG